MVVLNNLSKNINGNQIVSEISFSLEKGEILGFVGPNGAGKSTTLKMLACTSAPTSGTATIHGMDLVKDDLEIRKILGYQPETPPLYDFMKVKDYLKFVARLKKIPKHLEPMYLDDVIERCKLHKMVHREIGKLSKGFRQRVCLAQAILGRPKLLLLDEPTASLDPEQISETRKIIKEAASDAAVIFSTHILQEIQFLCDKIAVIRDGRIRYTGTLQQVGDSPIEIEQKILRIMSGLAHPDGEEAYA